MWRGGAVYAKRRNSCEADFGMNEFSSGGSKLGYRGFGILPPFTPHPTVKYYKHSLATNATER